MNFFQSAQIPVNYGSLNQHYLSRINDTVAGALAIHPRMLVARVDLRLPNNGSNSNNPLERDAPTCFFNSNADLMKRFIASLRSQIATDQAHKAKQGKRVFRCPLNYIWVRERCSSQHEHYHLALMVNKDSYYPLGRFHHEGSLACMVKKAWASALGLNSFEAEGLVHVPDNPAYALNSNHSPVRLQTDLGELAVRLAYFAKDRTKVSGDGRRNFGCSNPRKGLIPHSCIS
ncbi:inovirus Gp2 family protein [Vibrio astriarenae]